MATAAASILHVCSAVCILTPQYLSTREIHVSGKREGPGVVPCVTKYAKRYMLQEIRKWDVQLRHV